MIVTWHVSSRPGIRQQSILVGCIAGSHELLFSKTNLFPNLVYLSQKEFYKFGPVIRKKVWASFFCGGVAQLYLFATYEFINVSKYSQ